MQIEADRQVQDGHPLAWSDGWAEWQSSIYECRRDRQVTERSTAQKFLLIFATYNLNLILYLK
jgi:hypothetical protein